MITYYCPACWIILEDNLDQCPQCGYFMEEFSHLPYEEKLLLTLRHPIPENRMMAIYTLGNLKSGRALPEFERQLKEPHSDYYSLREILMALAKIGGPQSRELVLAATHHPAGTVRHAAEQILKRFE